MKGTAPPGLDRYHGVGGTEFVSRRFAHRRWLVRVVFTKSNFVGLLDTEVGQLGAIQDLPPAVMNRRAMASSGRS